MSTHTNAIDDVAAQTAPKRDYTTDRLASAARTGIDETAAKARDLEDKLRERASGATERVERSQEAAMQTIGEYTAKAEAFAKEQPFTAAGIAFAAGVIAAAVLRR